MAKFEFVVKTSKAGSEVKEIYEIDDSELELSDEDRTEIINQHWHHWIWEKERIDGGWQEIQSHKNNLLLGGNTIEH